MMLDIFAHELTKHLGGRFVLRPADLKKLLAQLALMSYAKTSILHVGQCTNGYTIE
jgi:hypothetical protein